MATWMDVSRMHPWFKMPTLKRKPNEDDLEYPESPAATTSRDTFDPTILLPLPKRRRRDTLERRIANLSLNGNAVDSTVGVPEPPLAYACRSAEVLPEPVVPTAAAFTTTATNHGWGSTGDVLDTDIVLEDLETDDGTTTTEALPIQSKSEPQVTLDPARITVSPTLLTRLKAIESRYHHPLPPIPPKPESSMALVIFKPLAIPSSTATTDDVTTHDDDDEEGESTKEEDETRDVDSLAAEDAMDVDPCNN